MSAPALQTPLTPLEPPGNAVVSATCPTPPPHSPHAANIRPGRRYTHISNSQSSLSAGAAIIIPTSGISAMSASPHEHPLRAKLPSSSRDNHHDSPNEKHSEQPALHASEPSLHSLTSPRYVTKTQASHPFSHSRLKSKQKKYHIFTPRT